MTVERPEAEVRSSKGIITLQDQYFSKIMDVRRTQNPVPISKLRVSPPVEGKIRRTFSQGHGKRMFSACYFSLESFLLLVGLTASLLLLPLILPPLPPPPFMLLLLPICILAVLMILAFTPSNARDATYKCL